MKPMTTEAIVNARGMIGGTDSNKDDLKGWSSDMIWWLVELIKNYMCTNKNYPYISPIKKDINPIIKQSKNAETIKIFFSSPPARYQTSAHQIFAYTSSRSFFCQNSPHAPSSPEQFNLTRTQRAAAFLAVYCTDCAVQAISICGSWLGPHRQVQMNYCCSR